MNYTDIFYAKAIDMLEDRSKEIHVTDLVYECLRKAYYSKKHKPMLTREGLLAVWLGEAVHRLDAGKHSEIKVQYNGVVGSVDELVKINNELILVEKKTCKKLPQYPYPHHINQVEYYYFMLKQQGIEPTKLVIFYISKSENKTREFEITPRDLAVIEGEFTEKLAILKKSLETNTPPPRPYDQPDWLCDYCPYFSECWRGDKFGQKEVSRIGRIHKKPL